MTEGLYIKPLSRYQSYHQPSGAGEGEVGEPSQERVSSIQM